MSISIKKQDNMLKYNELVQTPEYWLETIQNEIFRQVAAYLKDNNLTQTQLAKQLGVSKGYISQIMKGEFNYTLKKLIEISLAIGKAPSIEFKPLAGFGQAEIDVVLADENATFNRVAEPIEAYHKL
ncbi:MAG: helix-turn-helix transcriptional regulator [Mariniphaga sp.]